jgi:hypothetical protein
MSFVNTYARASLIIAMLMAVYSILGLKIPQAGTPLEAVVTIVQCLWMIFSFLALLIFPAYKAPLAAPMAFLLFGIANLFLTFTFAMAVAAVHPTPWIVWAKHTRAPIYYLTLGMAIAFALLNILLLRHQPAPEAAVAAEVK